MRKSNSSMKLGRWCGVLRKPILILGILALLICIATLSKFYSVRSVFISDTLFNHFNFEHQTTVRSDDVLVTVESIVRKVRDEINEIKDLRVDSSVATHLSRYTNFLSDIVSLLESLPEKSPSDKGVDVQDSEIKAVHPLLRRKQRSDEPADFFLIEEIRKYVRIKPNRLGKQNFMGANGTFTSIGHACFAMKKELEEYMDYDVGEICNDDWKLAQRLMVHGCDPLPRRRCFSRAPQLYSKPFPINESMWKLPDDRNVRWSHYRCKNFTCLANNATRKGFFKCADCFNLTDHEMPRWIKHVDIDPRTSIEADFLMPEVLNIKRGGIRIGLDFSVGTGTFAARMREFNITIISATINLGAPFSEMIALRGLVPLYLTINQRLPFFDNTLDLIHTTRFLDGWIDFVLLDFILYDWDRVLRPGGLLWIDSFFCLKDDLNDYLESFKLLRYRKHKWIVVPKLDKDDDREIFFSAVLEKPHRPFR
ncbi:probable methyltransferase At1g29790 [Mercurialis annua]|uniref:probable methyltransferase At1g29790 n=1 Tax=Mercurialis annua TaxID=3986 RepID=UPI002160A2F2|nr:probable methyltransferase At1g29790 [Mercurialis annua]